ncbi:MAG: conjugal transfer protein TrbE, partial [Henriciella sp.]
LQKKTYERFGLNQRQIDLIAEATPKQDYYFQSPDGARVFDLGLGPIGLAICGSSDPTSQALIDRLCDEIPPHDFAQAFLAARDLRWAGDLLSRWPGHGSPVALAAE